LKKKNNNNQISTATTRNRTINNKINKQTNNKTQERAGFTFSLTTTLNGKEKKQKKLEKCHFSSN